jgi:hypothetical protein
MSTRVIDSSGQPRKVYHGTQRDFQDFADEHGTKYGLFGPGHYFTESKASAQRYAERGRDGEEGGQVQLHEVYLDILNPIVIGEEDLKLKVLALSLVSDGEDAYQIYLREREQAGRKPHQSANERYYRAIESFFIRQSKEGVNGVSDAHAKIRAPLYEEIAQARMLDYLMHNGYDGIQDGLTWVCFRADQIHKDPPSVEKPGQDLSVDKRLS